jgi:hypothetical protein
MKVLVTGSRYWESGDIIREDLRLLDPVYVIQGGASGADSFAHQWCKRNGRISVTYFADWEKHKKAAGPIRNKRMVEESKPDIVLAYGTGNGTMHTKSVAEKLGIEVRHIERDPKWADDK